MRRFKAERHLVDPIPPIIQAAFISEGQRAVIRKRNLDLPGEWRSWRSWRTWRHHDGDGERCARAFLPA